MVKKKNTFTHHDVGLDEKYQYFERCVNRFRTLLKKTEPKLFLLTYVNHDGKNMDQCIDKAYKLYTDLVSMSSNVHLLVVYHRQGTKQSSVVHNRSILPYFKVMEITTLQKSYGNNLPSYKDENFYINSALEGYKFDIKDDIK